MKKESRAEGRTAEPGGAGHNQPFPTRTHTTFPVKRSELNPLAAADPRPINTKQVMIDPIETGNDV